MVQNKYIILAAFFMTGLLAAACGPSAGVPASVIDPASDAELFAQQATRSLRQIQAAHQLLNSPDVDSMSPAEQDQRFFRVQSGLFSEMATVQSMDTPEYLNDSQQELVQLLVAEQHVWDHMGLFALSGEEGQRVEARREAADIDQDAKRLASNVNRLLKSQGVELAGLLPDFALPSAPVIEAASGLDNDSMAAAPTEPGYDTASGPLTNGPDSDEPAFLIPDLTLTGGEGDIIILRHTDRDMQPAMVAHWSLNVEPGELMLVDYPFLSGDNLEMSIFGSRLDLVYMESPSGRRILELKDLLRPWRGDVSATEDGWYRIYLDNTQGDSVKNMNVVITYHDEAPDAVHLPEGQNELQIALPLIKE